MERRLRNPNFSNPKLQVLWAAFSVLSPDEALAFVNEAGDLLGRGRFPVSRSKDRIADSIACILEAAEILERVPSIRDYEQLRKDRPELDLVAAGSIRTRLAGGWNDCLRRAQLEPTAEMLDAAWTRATTARYSAEECIEALRLCQAQIGAVPSTFSYRAWALRPEVKALGGRRPTQHKVFQRIFGSFPAALQAAGIISDAVVRHGVVTPAKWSYEEEELFAALRVIAERLGRSPTQKEYTEQRRQLIHEASERGTTLALPTAGTFSHRFGTWVAAIEAAGLPRKKLWPNGKPGPKAPRFTDEELLELMRHAYVELGEPFTMVAYTRWRAQQLHAGIDRRSMPSIDTFTTRFGTWSQACDRLHRWIHDDGDDDGMAGVPCRV